MLELAICIVLPYAAVPCRRSEHVPMCTVLELTCRPEDAMSDAIAVQAEMNHSHFVDRSTALECQAACAPRRMVLRGKSGRIQGGDQMCLSSCVELSPIAAPDSRRCNLQQTRLDFSESNSTELC